MSSSRETLPLLFHRGAGTHPGPALRLAVRSFRREPATALAAIVILALGIGAATTIFAVLHGFGRPLPVPEGDRIVRIQPVDLRLGTDLTTGLDALETWASEVAALEGLGAYRVSSPVLAPPDLPPVRASAATLSPEVLPLLRVAPELGRLPRPDIQGDPREVLIGEELWRTQLAADPGVLGQAVEVEGQTAVVVGIMPGSFGFPTSQNLWWVSTRIGRAPPGSGGDVSDAGPLRLVGRLADGATADAVAAQLGIRFARYHRSIAAGDSRPAVRVLGFTEERGQSGENAALLALLGLVVLLVLVSCANVANLLHSRSVERSHLLTVHAALGAGPGQVALQVLGEAFFLALAGGALGLLGGWVASGYIETTLAGNWGYHWMRVGIDPAVVLFTAALIVVVTGLAGIAPALRSRRLDLVGALKTRTADEGARSGWGSAVLLGAQVAFSSTALVAAALIAVGLFRMGRAAGDMPGEEIVIASVSLEGERYSEPDERAELRDRLEAALSETRARQAALSTGIPGFQGEVVSVEVGGIQASSPQRALVAGVTPAFFDAFGLQLLRGRGLTPRDLASSETVAVLSSDFAERHFRDREPIGARLSLKSGENPDHPVRIVGVVETPGGESAPREWIFVPIERRDPATFFLVLRARSGDARDLAPALRQAVHSVDPDLPLNPSMLGAPAYTLEEVLEYVGRFYRTSGLLSMIGAVGAVLVALLGLYGVLTLQVRRRVREMGIRLALGAGRAGVVAGIVRGGLLRVLPGLVMGLILAWIAAPAFGLFLAGAEPRDPRVFALAAALYLLGTLAAAGSPALRAARTDPAGVLREE